MPLYSMDRGFNPGDLLATGVVDLLPELEGIEDMISLTVHHCPYCDGWEHHDGRIAVYGAASARRRTGTGHEDLVA